MMNTRGGIGAPVALGAAVAWVGIASVAPPMAGICAVALGLLLLWPVRGALPAPSRRTETRAVYTQSWVSTGWRVIGPVFHWMLMGGVLTVLMSVTFWIEDETWSPDLLWLARASALLVLLATLRFTLRSGLDGWRLTSERLEQRIVGTRLVRGLPLAAVRSMQFYDGKWLTLADGSGKSLEVPLVNEKREVIPDHALEPLLRVATEGTAHGFAEKLARGEELLIGRQLDSVPMVIGIGLALAIHTAAFGAAMMLLGSFTASAAVIAALALLCGYASLRFREVWRQDWLRVTQVGVGRLSSDALTPWSAIECVEVAHSLRLLAGGTLFEVQSSTTDALALPKLMQHLGCRVSVIPPDDVGTPTLMRRLWLASIVPATPEEQAAITQAEPGRPRRAVDVLIMASWFFIALFWAGEARYDAKTKIRIDSSIRALALAPDGRRLAVATFFAIELWDLDTRERMARDGAIDRAVAFGSRGQMLVGGDGDDSVVTRDRVHGSTLAARPLYSPLLVASRGARLIAAPSEDAIEIRSTPHLESVARIAVARRPERLALSEDGALLAYAMGNTLTLFDVRQGKELRRVQLPATVTALAFRPDATLLVAGCNDGSLGAIDVPAGTIELVRTHAPRAVSAVAFAHDGVTFATGDRAGVVLYWREITSGPLVAYRLHTSIDALVFRPDGTLVSAGDGNVRLTAAD